MAIMLSDINDVDWGNINQSPDQTISGGEFRLASMEEVWPEIPSRTAFDVLKDVGVTTAKGIVGAGESVVGLADIPTFGMVGKAMEAGLGYKPKETQDILSSLYSPAQQEANRRVQEAKGFSGTIKAMLENPSVIAHTSLESVPSMLGGGALARGFIMKGIPGLIAAAAGEGLISAGQSAEQIRQEYGWLSPKQIGTVLASGAGTAAIALAGGRLAQKLGFVDPDSLLAGIKSTKTEKGIFRRILEGMGSEGIFEEFPQSMQEQIWQNVAMDKPIFEGVPEAGVQGAFAGAVMGGGANVLFQGKPTEVPPPEADERKGFIEAFKKLPLSDQEEIRQAQKDKGLGAELDDILATQSNDTIITNQADSESDIIDDKPTGEVGLPKQIAGIVPETPSPPEVTATPLPEDVNNAISNLSDNSLISMAEHGAGDAPLALFHGDQDKLKAAGLVYTEEREDPETGEKYQVQMVKTDLLWKERDKRREKQLTGIRKSLAEREKKAEVPAPKELEKRGIAVPETPEAPVVETKAAYNNFLNKLGFKLRSEELGQAILDDMEEKGVSPTDVNNTFWETTYGNLNDEQKAYVEGYVNKLTGFKPGDVIARDKDGTEIKAKDWKDIAVNIIDIGNNVEGLEGTTRGYVSIIQAANEKLGKREVKVLPPAPKAPVKPKAKEEKLSEQEEKRQAERQAEAEAEVTKAPLAGEVAPAEGEKEPWEYTRDEWFAHEEKRPDSDFPSDRVRAGLRKNWYDHAPSIAEAVDLGKPVPPEVLFDYPDLAPAKEEAKGEVWDTTTTGMSFYDGILNKPEYHKKEKGLEGRIEWMAPDEYLEMQAKEKGVSLSGDIAKADQKTVLKYASAMRKGEKFPMLVIETGTGNQEGKHRALAAQDAGVDKVPVFIVDKITPAPAKAVEAGKPEKVAVAPAEAVSIEQELDDMLPVSVPQKGTISSDGKTYSTPKVTASQAKAFLEKAIAAGYKEIGSSKYPGGLSSIRVSKTTLGEKTAPKKARDWVKTDEGEWRFPKGLVDGIPTYSHTISKGTYAGKTGYHLFDENMKHVKMFSKLADAKEYAVPAEKAKEPAPAEAVEAGKEGAKDKKYTVNDGESFVNGQIVDDNILLITAASVPKKLRRQGIYTKLFEKLAKQVKDENPNVKYVEGNVISDAARKARERYPSTKIIEEGETPLLRTNIGDIVGGVKKTEQISKDVKQSEKAPAAKPPVKELTPEQETALKQITHPVVEEVTKDGKVMRKKNGDVRIESVDKTGLDAINALDAKIERHKGLRDCLG